MKCSPRWLVMIALASLAIAGCGTTAIPADTQITLERTMCQGSCQPYNITIVADGTVAFVGGSFVQPKGPAMSQLSPAQMRELLLAFDAIDYGSYGSNYDDDSSFSFCPTIATHYPSVRTSLTRDGITQRVDHYLGCMGFPGEQELIDLENRIDAVVGTEKWLSAR